MSNPTMGSAGRSLTEVALSGQVMINGIAYQAETSMFGADPGRPPIPADRDVVVAGWRPDRQHGVVLVVVDPLAPAAGPQPAEPPPTLANRIPAVPDYRPSQELERLYAGRSRRKNPLGIMALFTFLALAGGFLFSCATYRGTGIFINPCGILLWAGGGAFIGLLIHVVSEGH